MKDLNYLTDKENIMPQVKDRAHIIFRKLELFIFIKEKNYSCFFVFKKKIAVSLLKRIKAVSL